MENSETPQNPEKSKIAYEGYEELRDLIIDAAKLDKQDQKRIMEMESQFAGKDEKPDWTYFSIMAMRGLLYGYDHGELSFEKMMRIAWNCVLPLKTRHQGFQVMGALAALAVKIKPKERNVKKPPFPAWVKKAAVEYALLLERTYPKLKRSPNIEAENVESVPLLTLKQLALFDLDVGEKGYSLTEKTIYEWLCEYKRTLPNSGKNKLD